jgi:hypothetical protein
MNLTKGKIAKLYSTKKQSKKKYNKKRYRKNRTLRKRRGFNLANRTLKHIKRGGQKTETEIDEEHGRCLTECSTKHPDVNSDEYKACVSVCDENKEREKSMNTTASQIEEDKKVAVQLDKEINKPLTQSLDQVGTLGICRAKCDNADVTDKAACLKECDDKQYAESVAVGQQIESAQGNENVSTGPLLDAQRLDKNSNTFIENQDDANIVTEKEDTPPALVTATPTPLDTATDTTPLNTATGTTPLNTATDTTPLVNATGTPTDTPADTTPLVTVTGTPADTTPTDTPLTPTDTPLDTTSLTPVLKEEDKLSQAIETIVDHLTTRIAEKISNQGTMSGQQNGFESNNEAALTAAASKGGKKKQSKRLLRKRKNKSHKKNRR